MGMGPGRPEGMTVEAARALEDSEVIAGYTVYVELLREQYPEREWIVTGMTQEVERCRQALCAATQGRTTSMVCSGDAGVYGMAGLMLELSEEYPGVEVVVVSGVTAALSGAAILGAPLGHDFAVISLSDLLTPWEQILKRLACCAMADMAMALYNPSSKKRRLYLKRACEEIMKHQAPDLVCGYVKNIGREGQCGRILTLSELAETETDMFTTVFIGNSRTRRIGDHMVTPRGYEI